VDSRALNFILVQSGGLTFFVLQGVGLTLFGPDGGSTHAGEVAVVARTKVVYRYYFQCILTS